MKPYPHKPFTAWQLQQQRPYNRPFPMLFDDTLTQLQKMNLLMKLFELLQENFISMQEYMDAVTAFIETEYDQNEAIFQGLKANVESYSERIDTANEASNEAQLKSDAALTIAETLDDSIRSAISAIEAITSENNGTGNSVEVIAARYNPHTNENSNSLATRLNNNYLELIQQVKQLDSIKASIDYVDNRLNQLTSEVEVFENFEALTTKYPNGTTGIKVNAESGYWLYWNGEQWVNAAPYQAQQLTPHSVNAEHTTFLTAGKNKFNGRYVNAALLTYPDNDALMELQREDASRTAIIEVLPNTSYTIRRHDPSNRFKVAEMFTYPSISDVKQVVDKVVYNNNTHTGAYRLTTTANTRYLLIQVSAATEEPRLQVEEGESETVYEPYKNWFTNPLYDVPNLMQKQDVLRNMRIAALYGGEYTLNFDFVNSRIIIAANVRALIDGKRFVFTNTELEMIPDSTQYTLVYIDSVDKAMKIRLFDNLALYDYEYPVALFVYGEPLRINLINTSTILINGVRYNEYMINHSPLMQNVVSRLADTKGELYGGEFLIDFDFVNQKLIFGEGVRLLYNGRRFVFTTTELDFLPDVDVQYQLLYCDVTSMTMALTYVHHTNLLLTTNQVPIAIFYPGDKNRINLIDLDNCKINGEFYVGRGATNVITSQTNNLKNEIYAKAYIKKYYMHEEFNGVYDAPRTLADVSDTLINSNVSTIYSIFDNLITLMPHRIKKTLLGYDTAELPIYSYTVTAPRINNDSVYKFSVPKILVTAAIHGYEQGSSLCLAHFIHDMLTSDNDNLIALRDNVDFEIIPVVNPYGYNHNQRTNKNGVDINRNFKSGFSVTPNDGDLDGYYSGTQAESEVETRILVDWFNAHKDATWYVDYHNISGGYSLFYLHSDEQATIANTLFKSMTKKWRKEYANASRNVWHGYIKTGVQATSARHAMSIGVKSIVFETPWMIPFAYKKYDKITVETGIDAFGNLLILLVKNM